MAMILVTHDLGRRGRADRRHRRDVRRPDRRAGAHAGAVRRDAPPLHRGAAEVDPQARRPESHPARPPFPVGRPTSSTRRRAARSPPAVRYAQDRCREEEPALVESRDRRPLLRLPLPGGHPRGRTGARDQPQPRRSPARAVLMAGTGTAHLRPRRAVAAPGREPHRRVRPRAARVWSRRSATSASTSSKARPSGWSASPAAASRRPAERSSSCRAPRAARCASRTPSSPPSRARSCARRAPGSR